MPAAATTAFTDILDSPHVSATSRPARNNASRPGPAGRAIAHLDFPTAEPAGRLDSWTRRAHLMTDRPVMKATGFVFPPVRKDVEHFMYLRRTLRDRFTTLV